MSRFFSIDNPVWAAIDTFFKIMLLNVLWVVCSLPVFTMGASTTALTYACMKLRKKEGYVIQNFFHSFKENFGQATILFLIFLLGGVFLAADIILGNQSQTLYGNLMRILAFVLAVPYTFTLIYVFAVQSRFVNQVPDTIRYAFGLSIQNWKYTFLMIFLYVFLIWINTTIVLVNLLTLMFGVGAVMYICASYYEKIFEPFLGNPEESEITDEKEEMPEDTSLVDPAKEVQVREETDGQN